MFTTAVRTAMAVLALVAVLASSAAAQATSSPNGGNIALNASFDIPTAYLFRGLLQDDTGFIMWPAADAFVRFSQTTGPSLRVGTWNSLNTGVSGSDGPTGRLWYESDFYTTLAFPLTVDWQVGATYTAYTSPNGSFSTVQELAAKIGPNENAISPDALVLPYALVAFELNASPGTGQADGGREGGIYMELGAAVQWVGAPRVNVFFPIRLGLSLHDYYELAGVDHAFGFLMLGAHAELPLVRRSNYGAWNVHGGVDFYSLGDTPEAFNGGDQTKVVASVGIGFTY